ncbi:MAG: hypothetical protein Q7K42_01470 [Candidatus Diapherotrites archaeon]|nr:hypothetical protein [Candidatus Diapherotrites archaeon]
MPRMKSIVFRGKRIQVRNISNLRRHAAKQGGTLTGLSRQGELDSLNSGEKLPKTLKLKSKYSSFVDPRAGHSANLQSMGHERKGGKVYSKLRSRKSLSFDLSNPKAFDELMKKFSSPGVDPNITTTKAMRAWINGEVQIPGLPDWKFVADEFIVHDLRLAQKVSAKKGRNIQFENLSHAPNADFVFERLTGQPFEIAKGRFSDLLEGPVFFHAPKGQLILEYRGKRYDVTEKYNEIVSAYKARKKAEAKKYREKKEGQ